MYGFETVIPDGLQPIASALRITIATLGAFCGGIVLARLGTVDPLPLLLYTGSLTVVILLVQLMRVPLMEFFRELQSGERLGLGLACLVLFLTPSFVRGGWAPMTGLAVLFFPLALGLVHPPGFARYYMLCGISIALATAGLSPQRGLPVLIAFSSLLVVCITLEAWFFSLMSRERRAPGTRRPVVHRNHILGLGLSRLGMAMGITVPVAALLSTLPLDQPVIQRSGRPLPRLAQSLDMDLSLLQFLVQSVVIMMGAICLALLYRWLESRRPKTMEEQENLAMATIETMEIGDTPRRTSQGKRKDLNARETILLLHDRLSEQLRRWTLQREPNQTIHQWETKPGGMNSPGDHGSDSAWPHDQARDLAKKISAVAIHARYSPVHPDWNDVKRFERLCTELLKALRRPSVS